MFLIFVIFKAFGSVRKRNVDCLGSVASTWESYSGIISERVRERERALSSDLRFLVFKQDRREKEGGNGDA